MLVRSATLPSSFITSSFAYAGDDEAIMESTAALAESDKKFLRLLVESDASAALAESDKKTLRLLVDSDASFDESQSS